MTGNHCFFQVGFGKLYFFLYCSPYTGDGNWTNCPGVLPHDVVLRKIVARCEVIGGPLTRSAWRAGELISQVFMRLTGCADPAAVLAWEIKTARCDRFFFEKKALLLCMLLCRIDKNGRFLSPACIFFISLRSQGSLHCEVGTTSLGQRIRSLLRLRLSAHSPTGT